MIRRIKYYLSSIPTVLVQVENWYMLPPLLLRKQPVVIRLRNGCKFRVRSLMDVWIVKETCLDRDYESNSVQIKDGWTVIDIGAGIGEFATLVAKEHPSSQVYAYEPFPESFVMLEENLKLNATRNVRAFQIAIGLKSGKMTLATTGEAVQHTTTHSTVSGNASSMIEVQGLSLDDLFRVNSLAHCDFLKIDCEGCEFEILFNASPMTLKKINHICLEYHDGFTEFSHVDLVNYLQQNEFRVKIVPNPVHSYLGFLYAHR
ncbi:MAG: FkbM family methyltransferase [Chloroflexi bacterium]|nr:MAG: FkbM family methyltransferase [Chloroflexota bacterium]